jgi:hypothetical protein
MPKEEDVDETDYQASQEARSRRRGPADQYDVKQTLRRWNQSVLIRLLRRVDLDH